MRNSLSTISTPNITFTAAAGKKSKSMIPMQSDRPFLDYLLYNAFVAGYRDIVLVTGDRDEEIRERYGKNNSSNRFHGLSISYTVQSIPQGRAKPLGTADALQRALRDRPDWRGTTFTVCNSDNLYSQKALGSLLSTPYANAMIDYDRDALGFEQSRIEQFAVIQKDRESYLSHIIEKPSLQQLSEAADANGRVGVSMNIFRFSYNMILPILERVPLHPIRQEKELPEAVMIMVRENPRAMMTIPLAEHVPDLTRADDIARVREYLDREFHYFSWE